VNVRLAEGIGARVNVAAALVAGGVALAASQASATPALDHALTATTPAAQPEQVRWVCGRWGCRWRPNYWGYYRPYRRWGWGWRRRIGNTREAEAGRASAPQGFETHTAQRFLINLRDATAHGDARNVEAFNKDGLLVGFTFSCTPPRESWYGKITLLEPEMRRIRIELARLYCGAIRYSEPHRRDGKLRERRRFRNEAAEPFCSCEPSVPLALIAPLGLAQHKAVARLLVRPALGRERKG
jgi:hypothetical protein